MAITVKSVDWNGISSDEQQKIRDIIGKNFDGQTVEVGETPLEANNGNACTTACSIAQQAAQAACSLLPWPASTVCNFAAEKAGDFCRSQC
ncbi:hypothetical protein [Sphingomonas faeni]|uniref:hypothetical protein n=1 Tax=Sphingomonas faeni TaxID=185950 RepID=UPI003354BB1B